ncbi:hypothetical protein P7M25_25615, partial [Vibrio parahaemolyticus]|nr:hypothetical protein [Vibrio parahaemolyticus]
VKNYMRDHGSIGLPLGMVFFLVVFFFSAFVCFWLLIFLAFFFFCFCLVRGEKKKVTSARDFGW